MARVKNILLAASAAAALGAGNYVMRDRPLVIEYDQPKFHRAELAVLSCGQAQSLLHDTHAFVPPTNGQSLDPDQLGAFGDASTIVMVACQHLRPTMDAYNNAPDPVTRKRKAIELYQHISAIRQHLHPQMTGTLAATLDDIERSLP